MHTGFDDNNCSTVEWITSSRFFMKALRSIMPADSIIYLESYAECSEFLPFVAGHRCAPDLVERVFEGCTAPRPTWTEHLNFGEPLIASIEEFFCQWNFPYTHHVHGYHRGKLIFWFHDAFRGGDLQISPEYSEGQIERFCLELAPKFHMHVKTEEAEHERVHGCEERASQCPSS